MVQCLVKTLSVMAFRMIARDIAEVAQQFVRLGSFEIGHPRLQELMVPEMPRFNPHESVFRPVAKDGVKELNQGTVLDGLSQRIGAKVSQFLDHLIQAGVSDLGGQFVCVKPAGRRSHHVVSPDV